MGQLDGKQIKDGSIVEGKLDSSLTDELLKRDGSVALTGNLDAGGQRITNLQEPTNANDAARLADVQKLNRKEKVVTISTVNLTLSGEQTVNGISLTAGDRVLAQNQTNAALSGIYVVSSGSWSRSSDADSADELNGAIVFVDQGTLNSDTNWQQVNTIATVDTDAQSWIDVGSGGGSDNQLSGSNKDITASVTTGDGDQAFAGSISATPEGYVIVSVNGNSQQLGNGVKTKDCYFSGDSGTTARSFGAIVSGDTLHWNGSVAGFQLAATDKIDLDYVV